LRGSKENAALFYSKKTAFHIPYFSLPLIYNKNKEVHLKYFILLRLLKK